VVTGKLKGSDLLAALENGVSDVSGTAGRFIQLSGVRFAYDPTAPAGKRVLWAVLSDGRAVDANATYTVATNDFMQVGGDNYTSLTRMTEVVSREQLWEAAANYVKSLGNVDPQVEGRIIAAQAGQPAPTPPTAATPALPTPASILPTAVAGQPTAVAVQPTAAVPTVPAATTPVVPATVQPAATPQVQPTRGAFPGMPTTGAGNDGGLWMALAVLSAALAVIVGVLGLRRRES
jgi:5'-nucleotidase / UDP-sugar diphosphatase